MIILCAILIINLIYVLHRKDIASPLFWFLIIWTSIISFYELKLFGIYDIQKSTKVALSMGTCMFLVGYYIDRLDFFRIRIKHARVKKNYETDWVLINLITIFVLACASFSYIPQVVLVIKAGALSYVKMLIVKGEMQQSLFVRIIIRPMIRIIIPISTYCLFRNRKQLLLIYAGLYLMLLELLGLGSRAILAYYFICILASGLLHLNSFDMDLLFKRYRKIIIIFTSIIVTVFFIIEVGFKSLYFYLCGCVPMLDYVINGSYYISEGYTYGYLSFNSIGRIVDRIIYSNTGNHIELFVKAEKYFHLFETTTKVATVGEYNSFHTMFGDFYADFGFWGIAVMSFLFGAICCLIYKKLIKNSTVNYFIFYCVVIEYIFLSGVRFQLSDITRGYSLVYALLFVLFTKRRHNIKVKFKSKAVNN